jgi:hypothetical protein
VNHRRQDPDIRHEARLLIDRLESINTLPEPLVLEGLDFLPDSVTFSGTYADVYQREYNGQEVAIKEIRTPETTQDRVKFQQVLSNVGDLCPFV